ncbi:MAG: hypothetical protein RIS52_1676 [Pseudomonadota bacterium]|jgi:uroporphyrin-III C-methyltransferase / precorrin-2 dehydrogenase / sirohydrochlorin ferrochelatase
MHSLPLFVRLCGRPVIVIGQGEAAQAKRRLFERAGAMCVDESADAALAVVALDDDQQASEAVGRLKARGILVNAVDRPALCDFTLPAIVDRSPVLIAIGTGGASAGLAKALRIRLEALLPSDLGKLAARLASVRGEMKARWPDARVRRLALDAALDPGGPLDPLQSRSSASVDLWLETRDQLAVDQLTILQIASDDPDDLTLRQARLLGKADRIFHHPLIASAILDRGRADAVRAMITKPPTDRVPGLSLFLDKI